MRHHFTATEEVEDASGDPDDFGQYPTETVTHYDGEAHVSDDSFRLQLDTDDVDVDADAVVRLPEFPLVDTEGLSCEATFSGVKRPCRIVGVERKETAVYLTVEFTGRGEEV